MTNALAYSFKTLRAKGRFADDPDIVTTVNLHQVRSFAPSSETQAGATVLQTLGKDINGQPIKIAIDIPPEEFAKAFPPDALATFRSWRGDDTPASEAKPCWVCLSHVVSFEQRSNHLRVHFREGDPLRFHLDDAALTYLNFL